MSFRTLKDDTDRLYQELELVANPDENATDDVMELINEYLYASYFMSINPLSGIRKVLPQYKWTYHRVNSYEVARVISQQSDFIWCTNAFGGAPYKEKIELVTATHKIPRKPLKLFFAGEKNASQGDQETWEIKLAKDCGGEPEFVIITNR